MELTQQEIGPYQIHEEIGRGHQVVVFRADDRLYGREVALKILPPYLTDEVERVRAFISKGREAARLRHPNIAEVYDAGQADGYHYITMELADGGSLAAHLAGKDDPWPLDDAIDLITQMASGLDYAHTNGFVHGQLEPSNVLLMHDGRVLLKNFGASAAENLAYPLRLAHESATEQLSYLAPEQASGSGEIDRRTDLFCLGILAYRLFTGRLPFHAENALALLRAIIDEPLPITEEDALPPEVVAALKRATAKEPEDRWQSAGEFAQALSGAPETHEATALAPIPRQEVSTAPGKPVTKPASTPVTVLKPIAKTSTKAPSTSSARQGWRLPGNWAAAGLVGGMLLAIFLIFMLLRSFAPTLDQLDTDSAPEVAEVQPLPPAGETTDATSTSVARAVVPAADEDVPLSATVSASVTVTVSPTVASEPDATTVPRVVAVPLSPYEDPNGEFRMALPTDWTSAVSDDLVRFSGADEMPVQFFVKRLDGVDAADSAQALMDEYITQNVLGEDVSLQNVRLLEERGYSLNTWAGYEQVLRATHLGTPVSVRLVAVQSGDASFILGSSVAAAQEPMLDSVISSVIDSFQILPQSVAARAATPTATPRPTDSPTPAATATATPQPTSTRELLAYTGGGFQPDAADTELDDAEPATEPISNTEAVTAATGAQVALPPPVGRIAYAVWNPHTDRMDTYVYNLDNGIAWPKLDDKRQPDFRFDGEMVFNGEGGGLDNLHRMKITGQGLQIISEYAEDSRPHWSPDGKQVVFDSTSVGDRRHRIYVQNIYEPDDEAYTREVSPMRYQAWELFGRYPIFLADKRIAYSGCNVWENGGKCGIYVTDAGASLPQSVTGWPQDFPTDNLGSQILFMSDRDGTGANDNWDIYSINADGTNLRQLTVHPARDGLATASPDGEYIAFLTDREGAWAVYIMRPDGSQQRKLFDLNGEYGRNEQDWRYDWKQERMSWGW